MASITIIGGNTETIDETYVGEITDIDVQDGALNIVNSSNVGLILKFSEAARIDVSSFGQLNVLGNMIDIGVSDGTLGQSFTNWQVTDQIGVIWVETSIGSGVFDKWVSIDMPNSLSKNFADFADSPHTGRVFKWNNGNILFTDTAGSSSVPGNGCRIQVPNIVFTTTGGFIDSGASAFGYDGGGVITIDTCSFSDFKTNFRGHSRLSFKNTGFFANTYITYCNNIYMENAAAAPLNSTASGIVISYTASAILKEVEGYSYAAAGIIISYAKNIVAENIKGLAFARNSTTDSSVWFKVLGNSIINGISSIGGRLLIDECSNNKLSNITLVDKPNMIESTSYAVPNLDMLSSSGNKIKNVTVPDGGGARIAFIRSKNSPDCDVFNAQFNSASANNVLNIDTSFNSRFVGMTFEGYASTTPFLLPAKNNGVLLQNIEPLNLHSYLIEAISSDVKGLYAQSVNTSFNGIENIFMTQLYKTATEGELNFIMSRDTLGGQYTILAGSPRWSNSGKVYLPLAGDSVEFTSPWKLKGVELKALDPVITGVGYGDIVREYKINNGTYKELTGINLATEVFDPAEGFNLTIKLTATTNSTQAYVSNIKLETLDSRFVYPVDFEHGRIIFDEAFTLDPQASYAILFANSHGTAQSEIVQDGDGSNIAGLVNGAQSIDFTFDYAGNTQSSRTPDTPTEMILVVSGTDTAQTIYITQEFNDDGINVFNARTSPELSYVEAV